MLTRPIGLLLLTASVACGPPPSPRAEDPLATVVLLNQEEVFATLSSGHSAREIIGKGLFADLEPVLDPAIALARFGPPKEVRKGDGETLFVYMRDGHLIAICEHVIRPSDGGPSTYRHSLRAWPDAGYATRLPAALQKLVARRDGRHKIVVTSGTVDDWDFELRVVNKAIEYVAASTRPDRVPAVETTGPTPR